MTDSPSITIIMPAFNEQKNIELSISNSLQAIDDFALDGELICVNDGSSDETLKIIKTGIKKKLDKLTMTSTLRFVFQSFQGIHIFTFDGVNQIVNLTSSRHFMLIFLPSFCLKSYLLS